MKKPILLLSSLLCLTPNITLADMDIRGERTSFFERNKPKQIGHNYTYLEATYFYTSLEANNNDESLQGAGVTMSFKAAKSVAVFLNVTGGALVVSNEVVGTSDIQLGANYHHPVSETTDIFATLESNSIEYTDPTSNTSKTHSGYTVSIGLSQDINEKMTWGSKIGYSNIDDTVSNRVRFDFLYGSDKSIQYVMGYETANTDDNAKSLTFGLRVNY